VPPTIVLHELQPTTGSVGYAQSHGLTIAYYAGTGATGLDRPTRVTIGQLGTRLVDPVPGGSACGIVKLATPIG
jgi:hypothetical protein